MTTATDEDDILLPEDQMTDDDLEEGEVEAGEVEAGEAETEKAGDEAKEEAEEEEAEEEEEPPKPGLIPKHRYDAASQRAREAEQKLAELQATLEPEAKVEETVDPFVALDLELEQARADGDVKEAAAVAARIRQVEREERDNELSARSEQTSAATRESIRLDTAIEQLNIDYPSLSVDSDSYDQDTVNEVLRLQHALVSSGTAPTDALYEAVGYVMPAIKVAPATAKPRKTDVKKNLEADGKQPPSLDKVGYDSSAAGKKDVVPDISALSEEEFDALPSATLRKMRGDAV